ncbi:TPA: Asp-tRNA(Asn)/Glu-tRNA(Gln) amidotransferase subunit GatC [Candidatus Woesearchaeota archaeon]|nr:Asp-tRNA(Asn)/Glu-tRNA(Gln) amidotransferase subunit GatC [Candidatus Woesearchaeota archaeon]HII68236.1 Asp-tRNA(Asn)/Glu-tRNA(Gln) amidotransferase subunit GatC [Candidatus Woesearchaeota archaeon]
MEINKELITHVASTARLSLTDEEADEFLPQLRGVLDYFRILAKADTEGIKPSFHPLPLRDRWREDAEEGCISQAEALSLSQHTKDGFFKGPKAV